MKLIDFHSANQEKQRSNVTYRLSSSTVLTSIRAHAVWKLSGLSVPVSTYVINIGTSNKFRKIKKKKNVISRNKNEKKTCNSIKSKN